MTSVCNETKKDKFVRLAEKRTVDIIKRIRILSNLSSTKNYDYDLKQVQKIVSSIELEVLDMKKTFKKNMDNNKKITFHL